ncbi:hypothetical protein CT694_34810 (plasmid) [Bacillus wiedmannii bv. thuringiensis]|nr:hypothetical protein CT694_34810 [Bacillus wiedmannii bv. thuringiensis]
MNLSEVIKKHESFLQQELYTVRGTIYILNDGTVKIEFSTYAYALINEKDIDPSLVFPVTSGENPSGEESKHAIILPEGTTVELHVKSVVHTFTMEKSTRPFYICESKEEVVYLDTEKENTTDDDNCYKRIIVSKCYCCDGRFLSRGYGWVLCGSRWYDRRCCV